jgi:hypothetical protein
MTEYNTLDAANKGNPGDMLDVLIRNLETAKATFEGSATRDDDGKALAASGDPVFCAFLYASPGQICPFYYFHSLTEPETTEPIV